MNNNYEKSIKMISEKFEVKAVKTFMGRDGYGVNANLYYEGKKVAFLLDSGNGGCLDVDWVCKTKNDKPYIPEIVKESQLYLQCLINQLPKTTWTDKSGSDEYDLGEYIWNEESICNSLIDEFLLLKDFKKCLKKVAVLNKKKQILEYRAPSSDLDKEFRFKEGNMTF